MDVILAKIIDEALSSVFEKVKTNTLNSKFYTKITGTIKTDFSNNDINIIIKSAFDITKKNDYYKELTNDELRLLIIDNIELVYSWIISDEDFDSSLIVIQGEENKKKQIAFMKAIYHFIQYNRISYSAISHERIISKIDNLAYQSNDIVKRLEEITTNTNWSFASELNSIENKIKEKLLRDAISQLEALKTKLLQSKNEDEIEKYYQLYTEVYLVNSDTQENAIPYLKELITYTKDDFLKWYRIGLEKLLSKNFPGVKDKLEEKKINEIKSHKQKQLYCELKINYLMLTQQTAELESFLNSFKYEIDDYNNWILSLYVAQGRYSDAVKLIANLEENGIIKLKNRTLILQAKTFYFITSIQFEGHTKTIQTELAKINEEIISESKNTNDDLSSKRNLLILQGMILQNTNKIEKSYDVFEEVEKYGKCDDPNYLRNYSMVLMLLKKFEKALDISKRALQILPDDLLCMEVYYSVLIESNPKEAEKELLNLKENEDTLDIKLKLITVLIKLEKVKSAREKLFEFEKKYPDNTEILFQKAEFDYLDRNYNLAFENYKTVFINNSIPMVKLNAAKRMLQIGLTLRDLKLLTEALNQIGTINYEYLLVMGYEIIYSLILIGKINKAHSFVKMMEEYELVNNSILRLDMSCYFHSKNYEKAISIYEKLKIVDKVDANDLNIYLFSLYNLGKREQLLEAIELMPKPVTVSEFIIQSQTIRNIGIFKKAISLSREGYKKFPDNIQIMENFITMILSRGPEEIDNDILNDFYRCRDSYFSIKDKNKRIKEIQIPSNADGKEILKVLEENIPQTEKINYLDFLNDNHLHISILSGKYNYFFLWKNALELPQYKIFISDCSINDLQNQYKNITNNDLIIDLPSLITCAYLNILQHVSNYFKNVYISQDSISVLERAKNSQFNNFAEDCTSGLYELNNYKYPNFQINYSDLLEYLKRIDDFRNNSNVHTVGIQLEPKNQMPEELKSFLEKSELLESNDITYAHTSNIQLMLESAVYRIVLKDFTPSLNCFEIESLLYKFLMEKKIPISRYFEAIYSLIKVNYYCIYFNHTFLTYYFKKSNYSDSDETNFLQQVLISDAYIKDWVALLITNLVIYTVLSNSQDLAAITFVLKWIIKILKKREDFSYNDRFSFFYSLYTEMPIENIKQIILQIWEEEGKE